MNLLRQHDRADWNIISVTGHRDICTSVIKVINDEIAKIVRDDSVDAIYFGGASGSDTEALKSAIDMRIGKKPVLVVVVPDSVESQPIETRKWTRLADEVIELGNKITSSNSFKSYLIRDKYLVDMATSLIAFWNGSYSSGTGKTVKMAEKIGIPIKKVKV